MYYYHYCDATTQYPLGIHYKCVINKGLKLPPPILKLHKENNGVIKMPKIVTQAECTQCAKHLRPSMQCLENSASRAWTCTHTHTTAEMYLHYAAGVC